VLTDDLPQDVRSGGEDIGVGGTWVFGGGGVSCRGEVTSNGLRQCIACTGCHGESTLELVDLALGCLDGGEPAIRARCIQTCLCLVMKLLADFYLLARSSVSLCGLLLRSA